MSVRVRARFFDREAGEKADLHDADLVRIPARQPAERFVDGQHVRQSLLVTAAKRLRAYRPLQTVWD